MEGSTGPVGLSTVESQALNILEMLDIERGSESDVEVKAMAAVEY